MIRYGAAALIAAITIGSAHAEDMDIEHYHCGDDWLTMPVLADDVPDPNMFVGMTIRKRSVLRVFRHHNERLPRIVTEPISKASRDPTFGYRIMPKAYAWIIRCLG